MKYRKLLCVLLALALLLALAPMAGAEGDLFFVAVNDTIPVTLTSLPYTSGGVVYVPYTAFDARPGGVVSAYNATAQTFVLFTKDSRLVFDLATGETSDENQNTSTQTALFRNGLLYIPLIFCASHFGLKVSMLESQDGYPVLRFTTGSEVYDDSLFIEKAENLIAYRVAQQSSASDPADHPQANPDTPAQDPAETPSCLRIISSAAHFSSQPRRFSQSLLSSAIFMHRDIFWGSRLRKAAQIVPRRLAKRTMRWMRFWGCARCLPSSQRARTPLLCRGIAFLKLKICWYL